MSNADRIATTLSAAVLAAFAAVVVYGAVAPSTVKHLPGCNPSDPTASYYEAMEYDAIEWESDSAFYGYRPCGR